MASRPKGYGMTAEMRMKLAAKYDEEQEQEARLWMEAVTGEPVDPEISSDEILGPKRFHEALRDGIYLTMLASRITCKPVKHNTMRTAFKQMENINNFLKACEDYGVAKTDLFQTVDLYENQNMWQVVCCIHALGRKAQSMNFPGPVLGPKESAKNERSFTAEQLKASHGVIGLQMGSNKGASQAGMKFGGQRFINDIKLQDISSEGKGIIGLQSGTNKGASQSGMKFGGQRFINDIKIDSVQPEKKAMREGWKRGSGGSLDSDVRYEDVSIDGKNIIGIQRNGRQAGDYY